MLFESMKKSADSINNGVKALVWLFGVIAGSLVVIGIELFVISIKIGG